MSDIEKSTPPAVEDRRRSSDETSSMDEDAAALAKLGYKSEFIREFGNLETFSFAMSIMGVTASIATTFSTPLGLGGFASVVWCWFAGSIMNLSIGASIAELVSAYPSAGGVYTATAFLTPLKYRAIIGWIVGYLNILGQIAGVASTEWGLSGMILAAVTVCRGEDYVYAPFHQFLLFIALLMIHGLLNSIPTKGLARMTRSFVFINIGTATLIIITLLATTPRAEMHSGSTIFTSIRNGSGWDDGLSVLLGLLSVQWTMTDYDAAAHISEEVHRAAIAAPVAIFTAVIGTGSIGWILNIVLCVCAGDILDNPGSSGNYFLDIMYMRMGQAGSITLWAFVCLISAFTVQTALQANSRTVFAFSRDGAFPDRGVLGRMNQRTKTPIWSVWFVVAISALMGVLVFASLTAVNAIFSMAAVAMDLSYTIPVICRNLFKHHPQVQFVPGPFHMSRYAPIVNAIMICWTFFVTTVLCFPSIRDFDKDTFNYAAPITIAVMLLSLVWYAVNGRKFYHGPRSNLGAVEKRELEDQGIQLPEDQDSK